MGVSVFLNVHDTKSRELDTETPLGQIENATYWKSGEINDDIAPSISNKVSNFANNIEQQESQRQNSDFSSTFHRTVAPSYQQNVTITQEFDNVIPPSTTSFAAPSFDHSTRR